MAQALAEADGCFRLQGAKGTLADTVSGHVNVNGFDIYPLGRRHADHPSAPGRRHTGHQRAGDRPVRRDRAVRRPAALDGSQRTLPGHDAQLRPAAAAPPSRASASPGTCPSPSPAGRGAFHADVTLPASLGRDHRGHHPVSTDANHARRPRQPLHITAGQSEPRQPAGQAPGLPLRRAPDDGWGGWPTSTSAASRSPPLAFHTRPAGFVLDSAGAKVSGLGT